MGMYTELIFKAELKDLSDRDIEAIQWCISNKSKYDEFPFSDLHPFFKENRADLIFHCDRYKAPSFQMNDGVWILDTDAKIKNYEGEIEKFLDWIRPFVKTGLLDSGAYAETQYEEYDDFCYYYLDRVEDKQTYEY